MRSRGQCRGCNGAILFVHSALDLAIEDGLFLPKHVQARGQREPDFALDAVPLLLRLADSLAGSFRHLLPQCQRIELFRDLDLAFEAAGPRRRLSGSEVDLGVQDRQRRGRLARSENARPKVGRQRQRIDERP